MQENKITRVGGDKEVGVNVRVVAATNKDLYEEIKKGNFREDLYHRLAVILIHVPSLNERKDDISILAEAFLEEILEEYSMSKKAFTKDAIAELQRIDWTGNIRELRNVVERLAILSQDKITLNDVQLFARPGNKPTAGSSIPFDDFKTKEEFMKWAEEQWKKRK